MKQVVLLNLKPLSLNSAYRGRRFATPALKAYKDEITYLLPKINVPRGKLSVWYRFGVSTKSSDVDNLIKCFQDQLAEVYGFNDKMIYRILVEKEDVKKGREFVEFEIGEL